MSLNDTHHTDGECYVTPAHPAMVAALGRVVWSFLTIEERAAVILSKIGTRDLATARSHTAHAKVGALKVARRELARRGAPQALLDAMDAATSALASVRDQYRNATAHAGFFTAGNDKDGVYLPGIELRGKAVRRMIGDPQELHAVAHEIEDYGEVLSTARSAVEKFLGQP